MSEQPCTVLFDSNKHKTRILDASRLLVTQTIVMLVMLPWTAFGEMTVSTLSTGMPPAWVEWTAPEAKTETKSDQESGGQTFILIDTQVNAAKTETFVHVIKEITTESGVQSGANLGFAWDPSFQELIIHKIAIQRGTQQMDRLDPAKFKIIQQETDLNREIYNGTLSALIFLDDVRVGDRIEYGYTVRVINPTLKGRYSDSFILGLTVPIQHRRIRLLWPKAREVDLQVLGTTADPEVRTHDGIKEYIWNLHETPAVVVEDQSPSWFSTYPWIQLSEFKSWSEVAAWAAELFATTNLDAPELKEEIANLRQPGANAEQTVQGALEFVQNKIRYLGIEFGPNSYHPSDPAAVLQRRFGDCKDKAFLLCTLLRGLGYEATPVLIATGFRQRLPALLPAPLDFDHVIVRVVAHGATYWLDPTRSYQCGPITQRYMPEYSFGLLVRPGETALTRIPISGGGTPETFTTEIFRVGGQKAPAQLSVTSTYKGFDAEWMRAVLASEGRERMAKNYLNDYAQRYPGVKSSAPMVIEDSTNSDTLTLRHTYFITNFWVLSDDKQRYNSQFYPLGIHSWIKKPTTAVRSMPMELSFPRLRSVQTRIDLPREFKLSNFTNTITGPAAELFVKHTFRGQTVWLDYEYRALTNYVPASLVSAHLKSLDQMENVLGYSLNWQSMDGVGSTSQFNWPIFLLAFIYTTIFTTGVILLCRHQFKSPPVTASAQLPLLNQKLSGLGGWLILVGIGLCCGPIRQLSNMSNAIVSFSLWKWHALTTPGGVSYQPAWGPLLMIEFLGEISLLILNLVVLVMFFQKRRIFPSCFIILLASNAIFIVGDTIGIQFVKTSSPAVVAKVSQSVIQVLIGCAIWIPYMRKSRRVKATFVR